MTQTPQSPAVSRRNKILMQLLAFIALAVLLYYRPKIEAWVDARPATSDDSTAKADSPKTSTPSEGPRIQPAGLPEETTDDQLPDSSLPPTEDSGDLASVGPNDSGQNSATRPTSGTGRDKSGDTQVASKDDKPKGTKPKNSRSKGTAAANEKISTSDVKSGTKPTVDSKETSDSTASSKKSGADDSKTSETTSSDTASSDKSSETKPGKSTETASGKSSKKSGAKDSVSRMDRDPPPKRTTDGSASDASSKKDGSTGQNPEWGKLKEIRNNVFESTAGLVYRSGSADGHRLKHVMQHAKDNTSKPVHGVFDGEGDREIVLAMIDEAFDKTKKNGNKDVRKEEEGDRVVFTVNMKRPVGFMGGQEGERRGNPECRFIRIVLENDNEVISAFPTNR